MLTVAYLAKYTIIQEKTLKKIKTLAFGYSSENTQRELSNE